MFPALVKAGNIIKNKLIRKFLMGDKFKRLINIMSESLYKQIIDYPNIHQAYLDARQCKRYRSSILRFGYDLESNLWQIKDDLKNGTYKHGSYREFVVADSKKRHIKAAPFRDRVVHHALCNIIEPILDRTFIYDSYACRRGKGTHVAVKRLERFIRSIREIEHEREREREREREPASPAHRIYCLKCDVSKYFASIDKNILFQILRRKIRDKDVLCLIWEIIKSNPKGIPIGNLTSQLFANVYLNELDQYVKRVLRKKYYIRYMDDFLILDTDKKHLHKIKEEIRVFLWDELKLTLHPKKAEVFPIDKGVDFLGYVLKNGKRYLRKDTVKRFMKKRRKYRAMIRNGKLEKNRLRDADASWKGYCKFADSHMLRKKLRI